MLFVRAALYLSPCASSFGVLELLGLGQYGLSGLELQIQLVLLTLELQIRLVLLMLELQIQQILELLIRLVLLILALQVQ